MKYLIWDFDGTLGYREGGMWSRVLQEIVREAMPELDVTVEAIRPYLLSGYFWYTPERPHPELNTANAWWEAFYPVLVRAMVGVGMPEKRTAALAREFRKRATDLAYWRLFPDTLPVLARLSAAGWTHIVLSNHVPELPAIIGHLGLLPHLAAIFNSAQTGYEKPHPQAFRNVLAWMWEPEVVWMIGDNYTADVLGADAAGIPGILVRKTHPEDVCACAELSGVEAIISPETVGSDIMQTYYETDQQNWNERTHIHARSMMYNLDAFRAGRNVLLPIERAEVGEVAGKSLLHLQCHLGTDTLSWARLGARVTGVDFSEEAIRVARGLNDDLGFDARFIQANIYDLPEVLDEAIRYRLHLLRRALLAARHPALGTDRCSICETRRPSSTSPSYTRWRCRFAPRGLSVILSI